MMETDVMLSSALRLTCSRDDLVAKLGIVSRAVSTRTTVQILAGVLLTAESGKLTLGLARRVATGADGDPRPVRGGQGRHGGDRLVPPLGQGDADRRRGSRARGDHPGPRARRAAADRPGGGLAGARRAREPGHLR